MAQHRSQTIKIALPQGTGAGTYTFSEVLDTAYDKTVGVVAYVNQNANLQKGFQLAIQDDSQTYCSLANAKYYQAGEDCPKPMRLTPMAARCNGSKLTVLVQFTEALEHGLDVDMVFLLERADRA